MDALELLKPYHNFVLLGEAGCGKSELAVNLAMALHATGRAVHLFDLDMTKPLFRTRELAGELERQGVQLHFEQQFADAPTLVGGLRPCLMDGTCYTVLDVGGDDVGARSIGGFAPLLNKEDAAVLYLINPYRPWSDTAEHAGGILGRILAVTHLRPEKVQFVGNPYLGDGTTAEDVTEGLARLREMVERIAFVCVEESLRSKIDVDVPVFPIRRHIEYPW